MDIQKQKQLVRRIQADLRKEAHALRNKQLDMPASDCEGQAEALDEVIQTLEDMERIRSFALLIKRRLL